MCLIPAGSAAQQTTGAEPSSQSAAVAAPLTNPLTNKDVLDMLKAGVPARSIVSKIKASVCKFDKSAKALDELRAADAPYSVISAMMHASDPDEEPREESPAKPPASAAPASAPPAPELPRPIPAVAPPTPPPAPVAAPREARRNPDPEGTVEVTIPDSTSFIVELAEDLTSSKIKTNNIVSFSVAEDLKIDGFTVIAKGAPATARVIDAKKSRSWGRGARVFMTMQDVRAANGESIPVRAGNDLRGEDTNQKMKNLAIATGQVSWAIAPVWGLKRGGSVGVPAGTRFEVYVYGTRKLRVKAAPQARPASN